MEDFDPRTTVKPAYISYCRHCGGMTGCCVDQVEHAKRAAQFAAECIGAGLIIERKTAEDVRRTRWCECPVELRSVPQEVQAPLFT